jgi:hypothetical protein
MNTFIVIFGIILLYVGSVSIIVILVSLYILSGLRQAKRAVN